MIDVVIATYNRIDCANKLAQSLSVYNQFIHKIIIVDSSDNFKKINSESSIINHVYSSHKNQPYQRHLGVKFCSSDFVLFIDDDMSLIDDSIFEDLILFFNDEKVSAINLNFTNSNSFVTGIPKSKISKNKSILEGLFSGYPILNDNLYLYCGIKGNRKSNNYIEYFNGGSFACRLNNLYLNFNFQLFDLYEKKLGKGEDGITGYQVSKSGKIWAAEKKYFFHNDLNNSSYSQSYNVFSKRFMFSRLFLSYEYYRLNNKSLIFGFFRFHHFAIGRIIGLMINLMLSYSSRKKQILYGYLSAWISAFSFSFKYVRIENSKWKKSINFDINNNKID